MIGIQRELLRDGLADPTVAGVWHRPCDLEWDLVRRRYGVVAGALQSARTRYRRSELVGARERGRNSGIDLD